MADSSNGHARFEDLRTNVGVYIEKVHSLDVEVARISECLVHIEDKLDILQESVTELKTHSDPRAQRERVNVWVQVFTVILLLVSILLPTLK